MWKNWEESGGIWPHKRMPTTITAKPTCAKMLAMNHVRTIYQSNCHLQITLRKCQVIFWLPSWNKPFGHHVFFYNVDQNVTVAPAFCWVEMGSPWIIADVITIIPSFTTPMTTKATADIRFKLVAMTTFKANAFKAFKMSRNQFAWQLVNEVDHCLAWINVNNKKQVNYTTHLFLYQCQATISRCSFTCNQSILNPWHHVIG